MSASPTMRRAVGVGVAFAAPLSLYLATASTSVQFDDAAELTLCAQEWSAAHPPGYPVWVALAHGWGSLFGFAPSALAAFSSVCSAAAMALLFLAFDAWLARPALGAVPSGRREGAALAAALACACGATVWQWSNTVEVYALQLLATALVFLGLAGAPASWGARLATGLGLGLGLSNHHLSTVLLLPFLPGLVAALHGSRWLAAARDLLPAGLLAAAIGVVAYGSMLLSPADDVRFSFGDPSTPSRLWHHLRGGFFGDLVLAPGVDYAGRAQVLGAVVLKHLWFAWLPAAMGVAACWRGARGVAIALTGYLAAMLLAQWSRAHTPNMDSPLVPALAGAGAFVAAGLGSRRWPARAVGAAAVGLLAVSAALNFPAADRRGYAAGEALLADLDASAPPDAVVLLTSWELQTLARLGIEQRGFRPDLIVLPGSVKGTNAPLLARHYPEFHAAVRTDYDAFLAAIAAVDPDYVHTDWFHFTDRAVWDAYVRLLQRVFETARTQRRPVLMDRQTLAFLLDAKVVRHDEIHPCGMLFSRGELAAPRAFPPSPGWLDHPFLVYDLCAYGALLDYRTIAGQTAAYWQRRGRTELAAAAAGAQRRIEAAWELYRRGVPAPRAR